MSELADRRGPEPSSTNTHGYETARLVITVPEPDDAAALYAMVGGDERPVLCSTLLWDGPDDISEVESWIRKCRTGTFEDVGFHWVVRDRLGAIGGAPGRPLGAIGTRPRETPGRADVGYWLGRAYWGQGLMSEALAGLLDYGFDRLGFAKIEADVFTHNVRGRRLVERLGMTLEGTIRSAHLKYGEWVDVALYGLLADEWRTQPA